MQVCGGEAYNRRKKPDNQEEKRIHSVLESESQTACFPWRGKDTANREQSEDRYPSCGAVDI